MTDDVHRINKNLRHKFADAVQRHAQTHDIQILYPVVEMIHSDADVDKLLDAFETFLTSLRNPSHESGAHESGAINVGGTGLVIINSKIYSSNGAGTIKFIMELL
jgi:hypothetical protein